MTNIMAGPHPLDHHALLPAPPLPLAADSIAGMKVAYSLDLGHFHLSSDVRRESLAALDALAAQGAELREVALEGMGEAVRLAHGAEEFLFAGEILTALADHPDKVSDYVHELAATADSFGPDDYRRSLSVAGEIWHSQFGPLFQSCDLFVCPSVSYPEVPAANWQKDEILLNGQRLTDTDTAMTALFNMFSRCPVLAVPSGMTDAGLPTGLQLVGRPHDDETVFRAAFALEQARPWLDCSSRRPSLEAMTKALPPKPDQASPSEA